MQTVAIPEPGPDEVRVKVHAAGICLSDIHLIDGTLRLEPREGFTSVTLGHEVSGVIEKLGSAMPPLWQTGMRVLLQAGQSCGRCSACVGRTGQCLKIQTRGVDYDGGWAEYALARFDTLVAFPDDLPFEQDGYFPHHLRQVVTLSRFRRLDFSSSVSDILPLRDAPLGVERLMKKEGNPIRLVLRPGA